MVPFDVEYTVLMRLQGRSLGFIIPVLSLLGVCDVDGSLLSSNSKERWATVLGACTFIRDQMVFQ